MTFFKQSILKFTRSLKRPTLVEVLVLIAIVSCVIAILIPQVKWASSGSITVPVWVMVFDAEHDRPIPNARVSIFRAPPLYNLKTLENERGPLNAGWAGIPVEGVTDTDGLATIETTFNTGANYEYPEMKAHLNYYWTKIEAEGFGGVVVPVRYESARSKPMRNGGLRLTIGLLPLKTVP